MKARKWLIGFAVVAVLIAASAWWWRSSRSAPAKKEAAQRLVPKMQVASLNITDIDDDRIKLRSKVTLSNPLPVDINTNSLSYTLYIDSVKVMEDAYNKPVTIRSSGSTQVELPMELLSEPMARVLNYFEESKKDSADYTLKARFAVDVPIAGNRNFSMDISKRLPTIQAPKVKVKNVDLNALRVKKEGVDMILEIRNLNGFPLKLRDASYAFAVEDDMELTGRLEKDVNIPAHSTENVSLHATVKEAKVLKVGWKLLTNKDDTHFTYKFRCKLASQNGILANSAMNTTIRGTLGELMNAVKKSK
jgi:LEA14-like dessication related protein